MKKTIFIFALCILSACQSDVTTPIDDSSRDNNMTHTFYTGGYTGGGLQDSKGVYQFQFNPNTRELTQLDLVLKTHNPSWLVIDDKKYYAVNEKDEGAIQLFVAGEVQQTISSEGASPCHLMMSPDGQYLAVANYMGGNIAVFKRDRETGLLQKKPVTRQHFGVGPNKDRQESAHAHWVGWDNHQNFIYTVDLGIDKIMAYPFNAATGELGDGFIAYSAAAGAGPRHMVFKPNSNIVYIINELNNTVVLGKQNAEGVIEEKQLLSTLPADFKEHSQAAHIELNAAGTRLYVSNRGHDSIAVFAVNGVGELSLMQIVSTEGRWPRYFSVLDDSRTVIVANEHSNSIVAFEILADGTLSPTKNSLAVSAPTFIGR